jgi:hypothetical protein
MHKLTRFSPRVLRLALLMAASLLLFSSINGPASQDNVSAACPTRLTSVPLIDLKSPQEIRALSQNWIRNPNSGHFYRLTEPVTWLEAETQAVELGGHLVTINDGVENDWLVSAFGTETLWIGYTDKDSEGSWSWISNELSSYTNWLQHICGDWEPNDSGGGEDFATINYNGYSDNRCCGGDCCPVLSDGCIPGCETDPCQSVEPGPEPGPGKWNDLPDTGFRGGIVERVDPPLSTVYLPLALKGVR